MEEERMCVPVTLAEEVIFTIDRDQTVFEGNLPLVLDSLNLMKIGSPNSSALDTRERGYKERYLLV